MKKQWFVLGALVIAVAIIVLTIVVVSGERAEQATVAPTGVSTEPPTPQASAEPTTEPSPTPPPGFFLLFESSSDCTAPCWRGLRPGVTTWPELIDWIEEFGDKFESLRCIETSTWCRWSDTEIGITVDVDIEDGVVSSISFSGGTIVTDPEKIQQIWETADARDPSQYVNKYAGYQGILGLKLDTVVKQIGYPDSYSAFVAPGRHGGLVLQYAFFYEKEGVMLMLPIEFAELERPSCTIRIAPDQPILDVYFYDTHGERALKYASLYDEREPWPGFDLADVTSCWID